MINKRISTSSVVEVKITSSIVADAISHLKRDKSDPIFKFTSDCIINAPTILYEQLTYLFQMLSDTWIYKSRTSDCKLSIDSEGQTGRYNLQQTLCYSIVDP